MSSARISFLLQAAETDIHGAAIVVLNVECRRAAFGARPRYALDHRGELHRAGLQRHRHPARASAPVLGRNGHARHAIADRSPPSLRPDRSVAMGAIPPL